MFFKYQKLPCKSNLNQKINCFLHLNIQGFMNSIDEFKLFINNYTDSLDIISLNEHWLPLSSKHFLNILDGYEIADFFGRPDLARGGSCLLVKKPLRFKIRNDLKYLNEINNFEGSFIELLDQNNIFISIYRIPGYTTDKIFLEKFEHLLEKLQKESRIKNIFIASDVNINLLQIN